MKYLKIYKQISHTNLKQSQYISTYLKYSQTYINESLKVSTYFNKSQNISINLNTSQELSTYIKTSQTNMETNDNSYLTNKMRHTRAKAQHCTQKEACFNMFCNVVIF